MSSEAQRNYDAFYRQPETLGPVYDNCQDCGTPAEDEYGTIDLDAEGLCEVCADAQDLAQAMDAAERGHNYHD